MIVSIGGGSGHSTIISSLKDLDFIVAIVAITDDGGSSGKIREELQIPPPGDIRNCIIALAEEEKLMNELMQYRFNKGFLSNHTVGNILIAGLAEIYGDFSQAIETMSEILKIKGKVLPVYPNILTLGAVFEDGKIVWGETQIRNYGKKVKKLIIDKEVHAEKNVIDYINSAKVIIIGPGSLYTSIITNFLVKGIKEAIVQSKAKVVYVQNLFTEPGETTNCTVKSHLEILNEYFPIDRIDYLFLNTGWGPESIMKRYEKSDEYLVKDDLDNNVSFKIIRDNFIVRSKLPKHKLLS